MPEISDAELRTLQGTRELLGKLLDASSPDGMALRRRVKGILPTAFPELDVADTAMKPVMDQYEALSARHEALQKSIEDDRRANAERAAEQTLRQRLDGVQSQYGFTDEGMKAVVERLRSQSSSDVEGAAAFVNGTLPKAKPLASSGMFPSKMDLYGSAIKSDDPKIQMLNNDPMHFLETEAIAVMDEFARGEAA
jgi:hypothetical protein